MVLRALGMTLVCMRLIDLVVWFLESGFVMALYMTCVP